MEKDFLTKTKIVLKFLRSFLYGKKKKIKALLQTIQTDANWTKKFEHHEPNSLKDFSKWKVFLRKTHNNILAWIKTLTKAYLAVDSGDIDRIVDVLWDHKEFSQLLQDDPYLSYCSIKELLQIGLFTQVDIFVYTDSYLDKIMNTPGYYDGVDGLPELVEKVECLADMFPNAANDLPLFLTNRTDESPAEVQAFFDSFDCNTTPFAEFLLGFCEKLTGEINQYLEEKEKLVQDLLEDFI